MDTLLADAEAISTQARAWMECTLGFDQAAHDAIIATKDAMNAYLPKHLRGAGYGVSAFIAVSNLSMDEEDTLATEIAAVETACDAKASINDKKVASQRTTRPPVRSLKIPTIRSAGDSDDGSTIVTTSIVASNKAKLAKTARLMLLHGNETAGGRELRPDPHGGRHRVYRVRD